LQQLPTAGACSVAVGHVAVGAASDSFGKIDGVLRESMGTND
jgi:hypothetical protein